MGIVGADKVGWVYVSERRLLVGRNRGAQRFYLPGGALETSADGDLVTDAERQLMATLLDRGLID